jgi:hypothetical protein
LVHDIPTKVEDGLNNDLLFFTTYDFRQQYTHQKSKTSMHAFDRHISARMKLKVCRISMNVNAVVPSEEAT